MDKGIILSPYSTRILGKYSEYENHDDISEIFFQILAHDYAYIFKHLVTGSNSKVFERLEKEGLIKIIPDDYFQQSYKKVVHHLEQENRHANIEQKNFRDNNFIPIDKIDFEANENVFYLENDFAKELVEKNIETEIIEDRLYDKKLLWKRENNNYQKILPSFLTSKNRINKSALEDFMKLNGIEPFLTFLFVTMGDQDNLTDFSNYSFTNSFKKIKKDIKDDLYNLLERSAKAIELQKDFNALKGFPIDSAIDSIPSKKYMTDYVDLIEAKILMDSSLAFSINKGVTIKILNPSNEVWYKDYKHLKNFEKDQYQTIYKLILQNVNFPNINSIDKLLALRENKKIVQFKSTIEYWNTALKTNEYRELKRLEKHLIKANNAINTLDVRKQRDWIFYVSIGLEIAGLFAQVPLSLVPTAFSAGLKIDSYIKKKKYNWLMIE